MRELGLLPVPVLIVLMAVLAVPLPFRSLFVFEPPMLGLSISLIFRFGVSMIIVYFAARSYLLSGSPNLLFLGGGALAFGLMGVTGSWFGLLFADTNALLLLNNTGAFVSSALNFESSIMTFKTVSEPPRHRRTTVLAFYIGVLALAGLLFGLHDFAPPFFVPGKGSTMLNLLVLGVAVALFALASMLFMRFYRESRSSIIWWYALGLALIAISQASFFLSKVPGDLISWAGRFATCLGSIYFLVVVVTVGHTRQGDR